MRTKDVKSLNIPHKFLTLSPSRSACAGSPQSFFEAFPVPSLVVSPTRRHSLLLWLLLCSFPENALSFWSESHLLVILVWPAWCLLSLTQKETRRHLLCLPPGQPGWRGGGASPTSEFRRLHSLTDPAAPRALRAHRTVPGRSAFQVSGALLPVKVTSLFSSPLLFSLRFSFPPFSLYTQMQPDGFSKHGWFWSRTHFF